MTRHGRTARRRPRRAANNIFGHTRTDNTHKRDIHSHIHRQTDRRTERLAGGQGAAGRWTRSALRPRGGSPSALTRTIGLMVGTGGGRRLGRGRPGSRRSHQRLRPAVQQGGRGRRQLVLHGVGERRALPAGGERCRRQGGPQLLTGRRQRTGRVRAAADRHRDGRGSSGGGGGLCPHRRLPHHRLTDTEGGGRSDRGRGVRHSGRGEVRHRARGPDTAGREVRGLT